MSTSNTDPREARPASTDGDKAATTASNAPAPAAAGARPAGAAGAGRPRQPNGMALVVAALVLGLVLGAFGMRLLDGGGGSDSSDSLAGNIDTGRFQAVILTNDKVYFGRLSEVNETFFRLDDAFFLRETRESEEAEPVRALLPVNRELHAPENSMLIRQDEVVLVENLDAESPLTTEIERQIDANGE